MRWPRWYVERRLTYWTVRLRAARDTLFRALDDGDRELVALAEADADRSSDMRLKWIGRRG